MGNLIAATLVQGCATVDRGAIPVVDAGAPVSEETAGRQAYRAPAPVVAQPSYEDSDVVVAVPQGIPAPLLSLAAPDAVFPRAPVMPPAPPTRCESPPPSSSANQPPSAPADLPSTVGLSPDERLDCPVLALLP